MPQKVSIIIPTYNRGHFIGETLDSILAQTYKNWECIVVDDGSFDYTEELLKFYCEKESRIYFYKRPKDLPKGANACRNYGFKLGKGDYINWFDSDDLMLPNFLALKVDALQVEKSICCLSDFNIINSEGKLEKKVVISGINPSNIYPELVRGRMAIPTNNPLWRKTFLEDKVLFDEKLSQSQDLDFHSRIFNRCSDVSILGIVLFSFRKGHNSISQNFRKSLEGINSFLKVKRDIFFNNQDQPDNRELVMGSVMATFRYLLTIKNYQGCEAILNFVWEINPKPSLIFKVAYLRLYILYNLLKVTGKGETKFKAFLRLP